MDDSRASGTATDPASVIAELLSGVTLRCEAKYLDDNQLITIWDIARCSLPESAVPPGALPSEMRVHDLWRMLSARMLGTLCKFRYAFAIVTESDAGYLDEAVERDAKTLDWTEKNEKVDLVASYLRVQPEHVLTFLRRKKFDPTVTCYPKRATREAWFKDDWKVG